DRGRVVGWGAGHGSRNASNPSALYRSGRCTRKFSLPARPKSVKGGTIMSEAMTRADTPPPDPAPPQPRAAADDATAPGPRDRPRPPKPPGLPRITDMQKWIDLGA